MTATWLASHHWVWTRAAFEHIISKADVAPIFICGIAVNQLDMLDLFDVVFLLTLDDRLKSIGSTPRVMPTATPLSGLRSSRAGPRSKRRCRRRELWSWMDDDPLRLLPPPSCVQSLNGHGVRTGNEPQQGSDRSGRWLKSAQPHRGGRDFLTR